MQTQKPQWKIALFAEAEAGRRNRRTIDAVVLPLAALVTALVAVVAAQAPENDEDLADAIATVFGWAQGVWRLIFVGLLALALTVFVGVLVRRRWKLARDVLAGLLVIAAAAAL